MRYRHAGAEDHSDLASGGVLASAPGLPAFPVRLGLELLGRCLEHVGARPVTVWDPCCGSGQLLTTLGLLRREQLRAVVGSDADPEPLQLARRNLELLAAGGLARRERALRELADVHDKPSYRRTADGARRLAALLAATGGPLLHHTRVVDALDPAATAPLVAEHAPHVVVADVPHGVQTRWHGADAAPEAELIGALARVLAPDAVIAVVSRGRRVPVAPGTAVLDRLRSGHRACALVRAGDVP